MSESFGNSASKFRNFDEFHKLIRLRVTTNETALKDAILLDGPRDRPCTAQLSDALLCFTKSQSCGVPCQGGLYFSHLKVHSRWYSGLSVTNFLGVQVCSCAETVVFFTQDDAST